MFANNIRYMVYYINDYMKTKNLLCKNIVLSIKNDLDELQTNNFKKMDLELNVSVANVREFGYKIKERMRNEPLFLILFNQNKFFEKYLSKK